MDREGAADDYDEGTLALGGGALGPLRILVLAALAAETLPLPAYANCLACAGVAVAVGLAVRGAPDGAAGYCSRLVGTFGASCYDDEIAITSQCFLSVAKNDNVVRIVAT